MADPTARLPYKDTFVIGENMRVLVVVDSLAPQLYSLTVVFAEGNKQSRKRDHYSATADAVSELPKKLMQAVWRDRAASPRGYGLNAPLEMELQKRLEGALKLLDDALRKSGGHGRDADDGTTPK